MKTDITKRSQFFPVAVRNNARCGLYFLRYLPPFMSNSFFYESRNLIKVVLLRNISRCQSKQPEVCKLCDVCQLLTGTIKEYSFGPFLS